MRQPAWHAQADNYHPYNPSQPGPNRDWYFASFSTASIPHRRSTAIGYAVAPAISNSNPPRLLERGRAFRARQPAG